MCSVPCLWPFFCSFLNKLEEGSQISCQSSFYSLLIVWDTLAQKATFQNNLSRLFFKPGLWPVCLKIEEHGPITLVISRHFAEDPGIDAVLLTFTPSLAYSSSMLHNCCRHWYGFHDLPLSSQPAIQRAIKKKELSRLSWEMDGRVWSRLNNSERIEMPYCVMESFCKAVKQFPHPNDPIFKSIQLSVRICNRWN